MATLEVALQRGAQHALAEAVLAAHKYILAVLGQPVYLCRLVYVEVVALSDFREGLYARGQSFQFVRHIVQRASVFTITLQI